MSKKLWMNTAENEIYDHKVYEKFSVHWLMQITLTMKFQNEKQAKTKTAPNRSANIRKTGDIKYL